MWKLILKYIRCAVCVIKLMHPSLYKIIYFCNFLEVVTPPNPATETTLPQRQPFVVRKTNKLDVKLLF